MTDPVPQNANISETGESWQVCGVHWMLSQLVCTFFLMVKLMGVGILL